MKYYEKGSENKVIVNGDNVGKMMYVIIKWEYRKKKINKLKWRFLIKNKIYIGWMKIESIEERKSLKVWNEEGVKIIKRKKMIISGEMGYGKWKIKKNRKKK